MTTRTASLLCIDCQDPMYRDRMAGVEIDRCASCCAIWFDRGELDAIANIEFRKSPIALGVEQLGGSDDDCPVCGERTKNIGFIGAPGARLTVCSRHGAFAKHESFTALFDALSQPRSTKSKSGGRSLADGADTAVTVAEGAELIFEIVALVLDL